MFALHSGLLYISAHVCFTFESALHLGPHSCTLCIIQIGACKTILRVVVVEAFSVITVGVSLISAASVIYYSFIHSYIFIHSFIHTYIFAYKYIYIQEKNKSFINYLCVCVCVCVCGGGGGGLF